MWARPFPAFKKLIISWMYNVAYLFADFWEMDAYFSGAFADNNGYLIADEDGGSTYFLYNDECKGCDTSLPFGVFNFFAEGDEGLYSNWFPVY